MSRDEDAARRTSPEFDEWPVDAPDDDHDVSAGSRWIGTTGVDGGASYVYDPDDDVVYEGEVDEDAERITVLGRSETQPEGSESLGDWMRRVGDEDEWSSLSDYASDELRDRPLESTFQEKNTTPDTDYAFFASYSFPGDDGHEHTVEREFTLDDADADRPAVTVEERHLVRHDGADDHDAEILDTRTETFAVDFDRAPDEETAVEETCRAWHDEQVPP